MRYEVICYEKDCPGPKEKWADTEEAAREIGRQHEIETGHRFWFIPKESNLSQHPPG